MAGVVTGDRIEIQLAAFESSTQCLILIGKLPPLIFHLEAKAEELLELILSVDLDTSQLLKLLIVFGQVHKT